MIDRLWAKTLETAVLPIGDRVLGQRMMKRRRFLERAQWWPPDAIEEYRNAQIPLLLDAALEVEAYQELYTSAGANLADVRSAADLQHLPVVTKKDLREGFPERTTRSTGQATYDECSAGSTGEPFCVKEDAYTAGWYRATFLQILDWAGWRLGEPHVLLGMNTGRPRGRATKDRLLRCTYVPSFDLSTGPIDATLDRMQREHIRFLCGYPVAARELASRALERGMELPLKGVVTWGDNLDAPFRRTIESAFGARVRDAYGCAEGMWIASQCGTGDLYHAHDLDVVLELLDDGGQPVPPGVPGHVVVTRLHPGPTPLIRYRTGDLAVRCDEPCPCGRGLSTVSEVTGRSADLIETPSGNKLIIHFFTGILEHFPFVESFQVVKTGSDAAEVRVVTRAGDVALAEIEKRLVEKAPDMRWSLVRCDDVATTPSGKRRFVIDATT